MVLGRNFFVTKVQSLFDRKSQSGVLTPMAMMMLSVSTACSGMSHEGMPQPMVASMGPSLDANTRFRSFFINEQVLTGSQPDRRVLEQLALQGYRTVLNLRTASEAGYWSQEEDEVLKLGMNYMHLPTTGEDISVEQALALSEVLAQSGALPALIHCSSGNRAGALYALKAYHLDGQSSGDALEQGRQAGLTRLEPKVRSLLRSY